MTCLFLSLCSYWIPSAPAGFWFSISRGELCASNKIGVQGLILSSLSTALGSSPRKKTSCCSHHSHGFLLGLCPLFPFWAPTPSPLQHPNLPTLQGSAPVPFLPRATVAGNTDHPFLFCVYYILGSRDVKGILNGQTSGFLFLGRRLIVSSVGL